MPLSWGGRSPASCSLDPADTAQTALRGGGTIDIPRDFRLDIRGNSAKVISAEESMQCLNCSEDVECALQMSKNLFAIRCVAVPVSFVSGVVQVLKLELFISSLKYNGRLLGTVCRNYCSYCL